jgi:branched-chain amino acid transport system permease protein
VRVIAALAGVATALAVVPFLGLPAFYESFLYLIFHWIVLATSWNILSGYSGYISFGHGAFFGAGVYTTATLAARYDMPFLWTLPVAGAIAAALALASDSSCFAYAECAANCLRCLRSQSRSCWRRSSSIRRSTGSGVYLSAVPLPKLGPSVSSMFYLLALALALATLSIAYLVRRARLGRGLFAIHDDEDVAEVMGVPTYRFKLAAFALSCALAGIAGGIHAVFCLM